MASKKQEFIKVLTPKFRVSFPHLFSPQEKTDKKTGKVTRKYGTIMLFHENDDISVLIEAAEKAGNNFFGEKEFAKYRKNPKFWWPFRVGNDERDEMAGYADHIFINATSNAEKHVPGVVDKSRQDIIDESEIYSGCYGRASLSVYAYDHEEGAKGIAFGLINFQKLGDGEPLYQKANAADDFDDDLSDDFDDDDDL